MTYVEKNLRQNEVIVAQAKTSIFPLIPSFIVAFIVFIIGAGIGSKGGSAGVFIVLVAIIYAVVQYLKVKTIELAVTNKKIIGKTGVILVNSIDTYLEKVDNISVSETLVGKFFGYATIQISTTSCRLRFPNICGATEFKNKVMDQIEQRDHDRLVLQANLKE